MTRTCDLRFRKPPLYPAELLGRRGGILSAAFPAVNCRRSCSMRLLLRELWKPVKRMGASDVVVGDGVARADALREPCLRLVQRHVKRNGRLCNRENALVVPGELQDPNREERIDYHSRRGRPSGAAAGKEREPGGPAHQSAQVRACKDPSSRAYQQPSHDERLQEHGEDWACADEDTDNAGGKYSVSKDSSWSLHSCLVPPIISCDACIGNRGTTNALFAFRRQSAILRHR